MNKRQRKKADRKWQARRACGLLLTSNEGPNQNIQFIHNWDELTDLFGHPTPSCMVTPNKFASLHKRLKQLCEESGIKVILPTANYAVPNRNNRLYDTDMFFDFIRDNSYAGAEAGNLVMTMDKIRETPPGPNIKFEFKELNGPSVHDHFKYWCDKIAEQAGVPEHMLDSDKDIEFPLMTVRPDREERMAESDAWEAKQRARERADVKSGMIRQSIDNPYKEDE